MYIIIISGVNVGRADGCWPLCGNGSESDVALEDKGGGPAEHDMVVGLPIYGECAAIHHDAALAWGYT